MRWKIQSFWLNALIILIFIFTVSEVILRIYGYAGVFSINALNIISSSSKRLLLLLDNLVLFAIVIFVPVILAAILTKNKPVNEKIRNITKEKSQNKQKISLKTIQKHSQYLESKGLILGGVFGLIISFLDFLFIKSIILECRSFCGIENIFSAVFSLFYLIVAFIIIKRNKN